MIIRKINCLFIESYTVGFNIFDLKGGEGGRGGGGGGGGGGGSCRIQGSCPQAPKVIFTEKMISKDSPRLSIIIEVICSHLLFISS